MNLIKQTLIIALAVIAPLAATSVFGQEKRNIEGVWQTAVTPVNCATNTPFPVTIRGLFTFNMGGTMAEYGIAPGQTPALRSPGHGVWQRALGWSAYSFTFIFRRYDGTGAIIGSQKIIGELQLAESGNEFSSQSSVLVLDINGDVVGVPGCAVAVGTRFE
jgi:hypothetical protein